jgi:hypothetical protein
MKKLLLLLLLAPVLGFGQVLTDVLYLKGTNIYPGINNTQHQETTTFKLLDGSYVSGDTPFEDRVTVYTVPENKLWKITQIYFDSFEYTSNHSKYDYYLYKRSLNVRDSCNIFFDYNSGNFYQNDGDYNFSMTYSKNEAYFLKSGTLFWIGIHSPDIGHNGGNYFLVINEYSLDNNSFSFNEPETIQNNYNTPVLFPNPTSSLLALNSDKEYDIEVYDMAGNKVMALTGNTIDMSHLSSATYIVKALDKVENEEVSYKVVKN